MTLLLSASVGIAVLVACAVALLGTLATAPAASASSGDTGASFALFCDFSHRNSDDPIVHPDEQGAAHRHDFFGNTSTKFDSTYESMIAAPTTCTRPEDTAGYWFPTVKWDGEELKPNRTIFYYRAGGKDHSKLKPLDANVKVINDKRITWYCGTDDNAAATQDPPTRCSSGVRIIFPDCVATDSSGGQQLDSSDHRSHMVRSVSQSDGTRRCPATHPIPVPVLTINANFPIPTNAGKVTLSSGLASTMHADFWNTWNQAELERLVKHCINEVPPSEPRPPECKAPRV